MLYVVYRLVRPGLSVDMTCLVDLERRKGERGCVCVCVSDEMGWGGMGWEISESDLGSVSVQHLPLP